MSEEETRQAVIDLPPPSNVDGAEAEWSDVIDIPGGGQATVTQKFEPGEERLAEEAARKGKLRVAIIGDNYLSDATRIMFDQKITDVYPVTSESDVDLMIEFKPQVVFVCMDLPLMKNDTIDDSHLIKLIGRLAKETPAGVCLKSTITVETSDRIAAAVGGEWFVNKFIYSPEVGETVEEVLAGKVLFVGAASEKVSEAHISIIQSGTCVLPSTTLVGTINEIIFTKLGLVGFKAVKQTFFNQLHQAILDVEGANPSVVRQQLASIMEQDNVLMIPTFIRSQADSDITMKKARSYGGEYANKDAKLLASMTDTLTVLEECINLRNLKD
tara:strand:+ start:21709 stop:22692 length:984 start_codon:yes stop_codon:yes gene_type:complete